MLLSSSVWRSARQELQSSIRDPSLRNTATPVNTYFLQMVSFPMVAPQLAAPEKRHILLGAHKLRARRTVCKSVFFQRYKLLTKDSGPILA